MKHSAVRFFKDEAGATAIEYGLILALTAMATLSGSMNTVFTTIAGKLTVS